MFFCYHLFSSLSEILLVLMPQYHAAWDLLEKKEKVCVMHLKVWSKLEEHNGKELNYQGWTGDSLEEMPHKKFSVLELGWSNIFKAWLHTGWLWGIWYCLINLHCLWTCNFWLWLSTELLTAENFHRRYCWIIYGTARTVYAEDDLGCIL